MKTKYFTIVNAIGGVQRNATNPFAKAKYASLSNIQKHLAPLLAEQNCFILFNFGTFENDVYNVKLSLCDSTTEDKMEWNFAVPIDNTQKNRVQAFGATTTYAQRYALCVAFQIALDDEDPDARNEQPAAKPAAKPATLPELKSGTAQYDKIVKWLATGSGATMAAVKQKYSFGQQIEMMLQNDALNYEEPTA